VTASNTHARTVACNTLGHFNSPRMRGLGGRIHAPFWQDNAVSDYFSCQFRVPSWAPTSLCLARISFLAA
jgi:hypothetical protein